MARATPTVRGGVLTWYVDTHEHQISVGTPTWYVLLEEVSTFAFVSDRGTFTACKEPRQHGGSYWKAYRKRDGKLHRAYLGKSHDVTLERLNAVAAILSGQGDTADRGACGNEMLQVPQASSTSLPTHVSVTQPLTTLPESRPQHNLPLQLTSFVGREQDITAITALLRRPTVRLLTLTGTAGVGKTRLGLQVAAELTNAFVDGVCFVSLAPLNDPELVLPALAQALKLPEARGRSPLEYLQAALREQHLLLLLDNFEQVVEAAPFLVALLQSCPHLKIIVTSRASLRVQGAYEVQVSPLDLPDPKLCVDLQTLAHNASVRLFTQRAQSLALDFTVTETNAHTVAEICGRLDGLPLAIELAAARIKLLSPRQLLSRLEHRLETLTGGAQDLPVRQQALRSTLQWSYDLLSPAEQRLFQLLSVFVGGCTVEAVEALWRALGNDVIAMLDGLQRLLDSNLIFESKQPDGEMRLMMLETIREFGQECLTKSDEAETTQCTHAEYYLSLAEEAEPKLKNAEQLQWLERLEQEYDNLRAALNYLLKREQFERALRMVGALGHFYFLRAHVKEGQHWVERALAGASEAASSIRAKGLYMVGAMMYFQGHWERAAVLCEESLKLSRAVGDEQAIAYNLSGLAHVAFLKEDSTAVCDLCEESLPLFREVGDRWGMAEALVLSAYGYDAHGDYARARALCEESLALTRELGDRWVTAYALQTLGFFAYKQGDYTSARAFYKESLVASRAMREIWMTASSLAGLGEVAAAQGQFRWAARLWGAMENLCQPLGAPLLPIDQAAYESAAAATRTHLGEENFTTLWAEGRTMSLDCVLTDQESVSSPRLALIALPSAAMPPPVSETELTPREMQVLCLLAQGLTNAQIAGQLVLSHYTVNNHVRSILSKLGVASRSGATRFAVEHKLL